jgi:hypothetical protein
MREDGEGGCVELGEAVAQVLVCQLVRVCGAFEIDLVLIESDILAVGSCLFVLEGLASAFVALVVDLWSDASATTKVQDILGPTLASSRFLMAFFMGFSESFASLAGMMSFRSMSLTSSIMSVLSSEKATWSAVTRSRVAGSVSTATCEPPALPSPPNGL